MVLQLSWLEINPDCFPEAMGCSPHISACETAAGPRTDQSVPAENAPSGFSSAANRFVFSPTGGIQFSGNVSTPAQIFHGLHLRLCCPQIATSARNSN